MNLKYIKLALEEAKIAACEGEIPVGALIVENNKIVAKTHNKKEQLKCSTKHAEILAIEEASVKLNTWRLNSCEMYVTMEPCIMCCGALLQSRIKKIYYIVDNEKFGGLGNIKKILGNKKNNHKVEFEKISDSKTEEEMKDILKEFFLDKR